MALKGQSSNNLLWLKDTVKGIGERKCLGLRAAVAGGIKLHTTCVGSPCVRCWRLASFFFLLFFSSAIFLGADTPRALSRTNH